MHTPVGEQGRRIPHANLNGLSEEERHAQMALALMIGQKRLINAFAYCTTGKSQLAWEVQWNVHMLWGTFPIAMIWHRPRFAVYWAVMFALIALDGQVLRALLPDHQDRRCRGARW